MRSRNAFCSVIIKWTPPSAQPTRPSPGWRNRKPVPSIRVAVGIAVLGALGGGVAQAQFAPGPLSLAHADLDGITQCASCHDFGERRLKCLECHTEIRQRVEAGTGYHARVYKSSPGETDCARCHAEHRGSKFKFAPLDRKSFDHRAQTGFSLEGKHRGQICGRCHSASRIEATARREIKLKDLNQSFLGLRRECASCHPDPHQNQLGTDCLACHTMEAWKPASKFSHSRAAFPLTGLHLRLTCEKCHSRTEAGGVPPAGDNSSQKLRLFKGLAFSECQSCHKDQHRGAFQDVKLSGKCDGCHDTAGWKSNRPARDFDHNLTKFRLAGKHGALPCAKCHKESDFARPIAHELCRECHEDPHRGQFASRAAGSDCSSCHGTANFKPPLFGRDDHARSAFPLAGKHSTLTCDKCHRPEGRDTRYKTGKLHCPDCHADPHGGEFAREPHNNRCDSCHTEVRFAATTFSRERHAATQFALTGRHTEVECRKCHKPLIPAAARISGEDANAALTAVPSEAADKDAARDARRQYRFASRACDACHSDKHRLDAKANLTCASCHVTQLWNTLLPFDHSRTRFKPEGPHRDANRPVACLKCHRAPLQADGVVSATVPVFSGTPTRCSGCHAEQDAHGRQFSFPENRNTDCSSCHSLAGWKARVFNHDYARFALSSPHRGVTCAKCHKDEKYVGGKLVRLYRNTPLDCLKCH